MGYAPQCNGTDGDNADEPLNAGKTIFHRSHGNDAGAFSGSESDEEEDPDEEYRDDANWESNEKPLQPTRLWLHVLESNDILRGSDGGRCSPNVRSEGDSKDKGFGETRVGREVTK